MDDFPGKLKWWKWTPEKIGNLSIPITKGEIENTIKEPVSIKEPEEVSLTGKNPSTF
jgi:hypothetical protein